jgi:trehalose-6-phosphate synthase
LTVVIGEAMDQALRMPLVERRKRWFNMMGELCRSDIVRCSERFVTTLPSVA